ncbi:16S rRNA (cytosine(1402)-N(4))-methyltransferase RsmH [bacterium endosymbiont of Pedicinus badii]|uniref:16S rRNA (cytosine(1402)-N(4))-methyltransferase RsmH n=1 Tax=bacterium endosymbiont of Pedicinus badii TaxID=1719126 RepID=UPI0009BBB853|nr:16S rRNA (cytosine(1402)-N(4))-methyltransferase RsmH [bacterium endosymbiont of Pedicinus badii]OQM34211.1 hypothetical protein AOQ89_02665 [bacterium endosymbiont of Pedicinus badii]
MSTAKCYHNTVLLNEAIESLNIKKNGIYIDCTLGGGGHSKLILKKIGKYGRLIALDKDKETIKYAKKIFFDSRMSIERLSFSNLKRYCIKKKLLGKIDGILIDLGISNFQIKNPKRGFSYKINGPLDMRIDNSFGITASEWIQKSRKQEISKVLKKFGNKKFSKKIALEICKFRKKKKISYTSQLYEIMQKVIGFRKKNFFALYFQAIRIFINQEILEIKKILLDVYSILKINGRFVVISFHSLEDRIIKKFIQKYSSIPEIPQNFPVTEKILLKKYKKSILFKKGKKTFPSSKEIINNPSCKSAILRYAEKIL